LNPRPTDYEATAGDEPAVSFFNRLRVSLTLHMRDSVRAHWTDGDSRLPRGPKSRCLAGPDHAKSLTLDRACGLLIFGQEIGCPWFAQLRRRGPTIRQCSGAAATRHHRFPRPCAFRVSPWCTPTSRARSAHAHPLCRPGLSWSAALRRGCSISEITRNAISRGGVGGPGGCEDLGGLTGRDLGGLPVRDIVRVRTRAA
jgi:hypothetical protein